MAISDSFLQELKYKTDIEDIISSYVTLKRRGSTFVGLCPFHNEKTPSFTVYPDTQSFYCFGCGVGGDVVTFIKNIENLDYIDALKYLADKAGIQMPQDGFDDSLAKKRRRIYQVNREAAQYFYSYLYSDEGADGLNYYHARGLTDHTIRKFGLGYAPNSWNSLMKHLSAKGFSYSEMYEAGLVRKGEKGYYDNFRNRVITPIIDVRGNVIAFGGRVLDDSKPKYINTGDTLVYKKTNELFALNFAKDCASEKIILCEGYMDVISMHQAGFKNAVAGCGTALTPEQAHLISRYSNEVILAYDADEAGQKAVKKAIEIFKNTNLNILIPHFEYGKDPDEIIKNVGVEKFSAMLDKSLNVTEYKILNERGKYNLSTTQGKINFMNEVTKILADVEPVERDLYLTRVSEEIGVNKTSAAQQMKNYIDKRDRAVRKKQYTSVITDTIRNNNRESMQTGASSKYIKAVERFLYLLIKYPDCAKLLGDFNKDNLISGFFQKVYEICLENIDNGFDNDPMNFSSKLSSQEIARLTGIIAKGEASENPKEEFKDCMNTIVDEHNKKNKKSAVDMSDDEFRKLFKNT